MSNVIRNTCGVCGGPTRLATDTYEQSCASCNRIAELEATIAKRDNLLTLIRDDLRIRSKDGLVDLSDSIWERLERTLLGEDK